MSYYLPLRSNCYYHIYNRGNNGENLFHKKENYHYFLNKYSYYLDSYVDTFAYCLLPNHFHLLVRVKDFSLKTVELVKGKQNLTEPEAIVSESFRRLFTSYTKSINKQESRTGSLFQKNFKRKLTDNQSYFDKLVYYIHSNPQRHGIIDDFKVYPYSSYASMLSEKPSKLFRHETLGWFGNKNGFESFHSKSCPITEINNWIIED